MEALDWSNGLRDLDEDELVVLIDSLEAVLNLPLLALDRKIVRMIQWRIDVCAAAYGALALYERRADSGERQ